MSAHSAHVRPLLTVEQYLAEVLALVTPLSETENVPVRTAAGRTLAEPVVARCDVPTFANSAMDGFAVRARDLSPGVVLSVVGEVLAGSPEDPAFGAGECVRIMTGAPLPASSDAVVPVEQTTEVPLSGDADPAAEGASIKNVRIDVDLWPADGPQVYINRDQDSRDHRTRVRIDEVVPVGKHVRGAGEDVRAGTIVLEAGTRLGPRELAAASAAGAGTLVCVRQPWIGVITTGDELVAPGVTLGRGQIYESNGTFLAGAISRDGGVPLVPGVVRDTTEALTEALDALAARCDLIVVSGGVSVGDADVTRIVLEAGGARFRHVRMQPGKPQGWARWGARGVPVVALPGNPLSASISYEMFVSPALDRMFDRTAGGWTVAVAIDAWSCPPGRRQLIPVFLDVDASGRQTVRPAHRHGSASHMVTSLVAANALAAVGEDVDQVVPGDILTVKRLA